MAGLSTDSSPDGPIAVELLTGHQTIDAEHAALFAILKNARSLCQDMATKPTCASCGEDRRSHCENGLVRLLGDLLSFVFDHFKSEESIMRESLLIMIDRHVCEMHMEDHAAISSKIERIVAALDPVKTVSLLRELDRVVGHWLASHIATHDMALVAWVEREDSVLRSAI